MPLIRIILTAILAFTALSCETVSDDTPVYSGNSPDENEEENTEETGDDADGDEGTSISGTIANWDDLAAEYSLLTIDINELTLYVTAFTEGAEKTALGAGGEIGAGGSFTFTLQDADTALLTENTSSTWPGLTLDPENGTYSLTALTQSPGSIEIVTSEGDSLAELRYISYDPNAAAAYPARECLLQYSDAEFTVTGSTTHEGSAVTAADTAFPAGWSWAALDYTSAAELAVTSEAVGDVSGLSWYAELP